MAHKPGTTLKPLVKVPAGPAPCWPWLGRTNTVGYPVKTWHGNTIPAARWLWALLFGGVPEGMVVSMSCGNKSCVNPAHMRLCTQAEAVRGGIGASLTPGDVLEIRKLRGARSQGDVERTADRLAVSPGAVRDVLAGRTWAKKARRPRAAALMIEEG